ncbi:UDP-glucose dehydrogenase [Dehalogenimonas sp. WBC-2]|nr:UDP-glucose dehydrogenase [Dehalogenimonas sp. WBC-2]
MNRNDQSVAIIGLGYVGLPLAVAFAEAGLSVVGIDRSVERVDKVNLGVSYIDDVSSPRLLEVVNQGRMKASTNFDSITGVDAMCICVPTPLTNTKEPDISYIVAVTKEIAPRLTKGQLVILESTTYPGTTRDVVLPMLESSGKVHGRDFYLAFSPERVDPNSKKFNIKNTPKVVGGINQAATKRACKLYRKVADSLVPVSSPEVAEMTKLFENVFRSVNIALVNELAQLCDHMKTSVWEVIDAAATKPFGFMKFLPGPGVGGHCIPLDPYYLAAKAREYDYHMRFIELAAATNEHMPFYVVYRIMDALNAFNKSLKGAKILILGIAYKPDVADERESPVLKIIEVLCHKGAQVSYHDPYITSIQSGGGISSVELTKETLHEADCVIIAANHSCFNYGWIADNAQLIFDTRGATRGLNNTTIMRLGESGFQEYIGCMDSDV